MHIFRHNSNKNRTLWIKFGRVNRKSISYNLPLKLLMQQSTSCSHRHDNQVMCHRQISSPSHATIHLVRPLATKQPWPEPCWLQSLGLSSGPGVSETRTWRWWAETASCWGVVTLQSGHHWWGHRWVEEATSGMRPNEGTSFWTFDVNCNVG